MKSIKIENLQGRIYTKSGIMSNSTFNCFIDDIRCKDCIFKLKNGNCGGGDNDLDFNAIKNTKFRLKELTITNLKRFLIINKPSQYEK